MGKTTVGSQTPKRDKILGSLLAIVGTVPWLAEKNGMTVPIELVKAGGVITIIVLGILAYQLCTFNPKRLSGRWGISIIAFTAGIASTCWVIYPITMAVYDHRKFSSETQETIYKKTFINETVDIDGKLFDRCTFSNVTFIYHGLGRPTFIEPRFMEGAIHWHSDNVAVNQYMKLMEYVQALPGSEKFRFRALEDDGRHRDLSH